MVEAWKVVGRKLLWRPDDSLLWLWSRSTIELLLLLLLRLLLLKLPWLELWLIAPILLLLLLWSTQLIPRWGIHHVVHGRSTARTITASGSKHHLCPLLLINLRNGLHHSLLINVTLIISLYDGLMNYFRRSCRWMVSPACYRLVFFSSVPTWYD
jgi:hypothetical protein